MLIAIDIAAIGAAGLIGWGIGLAMVAPKVARLTDRLEIAAARSAQLVKRNRELNQRIAEHETYRATRSAAIAKGNRTRSAKFHAKRAAKVAELASAK